MIYHFDSIFHLLPFSNFLSGIFLKWLLFKCEEVVFIFLCLYFHHMFILLQNTPNDLAKEVAAFINKPLLWFFQFLTVSVFLCDLGDANRKKNPSHAFSIKYYLVYLYYQQGSLVLAPCKLTFISNTIGFPNVSFCFQVTSLWHSLRTQSIIIFPFWTCNFNNKGLHWEGSFCIIWMACISTSLYPVPTVSLTPHLRLLWCSKHPLQWHVSNAFPPPSNTLNPAIFLQLISVSKQRIKLLSLWGFKGTEFL